MRQEPKAIWTPESLAMVGALTQSLVLERVSDLLIPQTLVRDAVVGSKDLVAVARRHKLFEPTARAVSALNEDRGAHAQLVNAAHRDAMAAMRAAACVRRTSHLLEEAGCRPIFIKGVSLAVQTTGKLEARGVGDVDVLVEPAMAQVAADAVVRAGGRPRPAVGTVRAQDAEHAIEIDWLNTTVDVHRRLTHFPVFALPDHASLWERSVPVDLGGSTVRTLSVEHAAVHIAISSSHDSWSQLIRVADLARLLRLTDSDPDWAAPTEVAHSWGASRQWAVGLAMVRRLRSDIPKQDPLSEALATRTWLWLASGRQLRLSTGLRDKATRDLYRVASAASPAYTRWWLGRSLRRLHFRPAHPAVSVPT